MELIRVGSRIDQVSDKDWNLGCAVKETDKGWGGEREMKAWGMHWAFVGVDTKSPKKLQSQHNHDSEN